MDNKIIDLFLDNNFLLEDLFGSKAHNLTIKFSALIATLNNKRIDKETLNKNLDLIKIYTDDKSVFRGENALMLATLMHLSTDPEDKLKCTMALYNSLEVHFDSNSFLALSSEILCSFSDDITTSELSEKLNCAFTYTKKNHNFLADKENLSICALIASSFENLSLKLQEAEQSYKHLESIRFFPSKHLILLSQALTFSKEDIQTKTLQVVRLHDFLEKNNFVIDGKALPLLAFAIMAESDIEILTAKIKEIQNILRENVRFMTYKLDDDIELSIGMSLTIASLTSLEESSFLIPLTVFLLNIATRDVKSISQPFSRKIFET